LLEEESRLERAQRVFVHDTPRHTVETQLGGRIACGDEAVERPEHLFRGMRQVLAERGYTPAVNRVRAPDRLHEARARDVREEQHLAHRPGRTSEDGQLPTR